MTVLDSAPIEASSPMPVGKFTTTAHRTLDVATGEALWDIYLASFAPMVELTAARHILTREEFDTECLSETVIKFVVRDEEGTPWGLATMTNDFSTVEWVQPEFYAAKFPTLFREGRVYYIGLLLVHPAAQAMGASSPMIAGIGNVLEDTAGIACFDMCSHNFSTRRLHDMIRLLSGRAGNPMSPVLTLDTQHYVAFVPESVRSELEHLFPA